MLKLQVPSTPSMWCVHLVDAVEWRLVPRRATHWSLSTQALLGLSTSMHELKGDIVAAVPNDWMASRAVLPSRYAQFQYGKELYREQLFKRSKEKNICPTNNGGGRAGRCNRSDCPDPHECLFCWSTAHGAPQCPKAKEELKKME